MQHDFTMFTGSIATYFFHFLRDITPVSLPRMICDGMLLRRRIRVARRDRRKQEVRKYGTRVDDAWHSVISCDVVWIFERPLPSSRLSLRSQEREANGWRRELECLQRNNIPFHTRRNLFRELYHYVIIRDKKPGDSARKHRRFVDISKLSRTMRNYKANESIK